MARPPIIISNGGIVDLLTNGLNQTQKDKVITNLKNLIKNEKMGSIKTKVSKIKKTSSGGNNAPRSYWRLKNDKKYEDNLNYYKNHPIWKEVFADMDGSEE